MECVYELFCYGADFNIGDGSSDTPTMGCTCNVSILKYFGPYHEVLIALVSSQGSDKPAFMHSLTRAFAACIHKIWS